MGRARAHRRKARLSQRQPALRNAPGAQYRRYGFACVYGVLLTRWDYAGLGPGPAYPLGTHNVITMRMPPPEGWGPDWSGTKRVWLLDTRYAGRALVRGRQLDGPNEMRFVLGRPGFTAAKIYLVIFEARVELNGP